MSFSDMPIESAFCSKCFFTIFASKNQSMKFVAMYTFFKLRIENLVTYLAGDNGSFVFSYVVSVDTLLVNKIDLADFAMHLIFQTISSNYNHNSQLPVDIWKSNRLIIKKSSTFDTY